MFNVCYINLFSVSSVKEQFKGWGKNLKSPSSKCMATHILRTHFSIKPSLASYVDHKNIF